MYYVIFNGNYYHITNELLNLINNYAHHSSTIEVHFSTENAADAITKCEQLNSKLG